MKIALAQINPTVGDFHENRKNIESKIAAAKSRGAELVLFSEQVLGGYPARDLVERNSFIKRNQETLDAIAPLSKDIVIVLGLVTPNEESSGHDVYNSAAVLKAGKVSAVYAKRLLPTYDIFDESRYFQPGSKPVTFDCAGKKIGISVCEDIWNPKEFWSRPRYEHDPIVELIACKPDLIINTSASPYSLGHDKIRLDLLKVHAKRHRVPIALCNQVGANDDLIFDGQSCVVNANGELIARGAAFEEDLLVVDPFSENPIPDKQPFSDMEFIRRALVLGIRDYVRKCGFSDLLIGLSGGIDSAVAASLAAEAVGADHVTCILMPSKFSSKASVDDALELAKKMNVKTHTIKIHDLYEAYIKNLKPVFKDSPFDVTEENIQARIRGNLLMALSNKFNSLVITTGNKSEIAVGYCTLYGDLLGGLAVLSDLPKTMVYPLAHHINEVHDWIPNQIITKPPSAELKPGQVDQDTLPPYDVLDGILKRYIEDGESYQQMIDAGFDHEIVEKVITMVDRNEYKRRQSPIGLRVTSKAFGSGRRMPIAQRFKRF